MLYKNPKKVYRHSGTTNMDGILVKKSTLKVLRSLMKEKMENQKSLNQMSNKI